MAARAASIRQPAQELITYHLPPIPDHYHPIPINYSQQVWKMAWIVL